MKPLVAFLAGSLAVNAALVTVLLFRSAPAVVRPVSSARAAAHSSDAAAAARANEALIAALTSGDAAAMTAAGVPMEVVRQLAAARAFARLAALSRAIERPPAAAEYWRNTRALRSPPSREQRSEQRAAEREFETAMREAFGDGWNEDWRGGRYSFLPADRQEQLRRIERDYEEMRREISADGPDLQLPADREKLKLLNAEMERDLAATLSPAERQQIELRSSNTARAIIDHYGDVLASEEEYQRLYALRKAFDDRYNTEDYHTRPHTPEENRARAEAERKLNDDLRAAIGEDRWASASRANDNEYLTLGALASRLGLAAGTPDAVYALRESYAAQSLALHSNAALSETERRKQLTELATRAKSELRERLGADGADAYARQAGWVQTLQSGAAFVTDARLLPPGTPRPPSGATAYRLPATAVPTPKR